MSLQVDVQKKLGSFTLKVRFESMTGITAIFGHSGAGKSSLVNIISGLQKPDIGSILLNQRVLFNAKINIPPAQRRIGYIFQESRLFPHLNVQQNLVYGERFTPKARRYADFAQIIHLLGIEHLLQRRPGKLSGGEKQRVAIGRALLVSPELLLMDEPLAALDAARKAEILPYIKALKNSLNIAIVYVSHSLEEIFQLSDYVVILENGQVKQQGKISLIKSILQPVLHDLTSIEITATVIAHFEQQTQLRYQDSFLTVPLLDSAIGETVLIKIQTKA